MFNLLFLTSLIGHLILVFQNQHCIYIHFLLSSIFLVLFCKYSAVIIHHAFLLCFHLVLFDLQILQKCYIFNFQILLILVLFYSQCVFLMLLLEIC